MKHTINYYPDSIQEILTDIQKKQSDGYIIESVEYLPFDGKNTIHITFNKK